MRKKEIISHLYQNTDGDWAIQSNEDHQKGVARLAKRFAGDFNMSSWGEVLGFLHDKGKEKKAFQEYINKVSGLAPNITVSGNKDHAYVGALVAKLLYPRLHLLLDNIIMGHHRGLYDMDECMSKLNEESIPDEIDVRPLGIELKPPTIRHKEDAHHLIRMLYSCLVDADFLDTESFMNPEQAKLRQQSWDMRDLLTKLERHLANLSSSAPKTLVNDIRQYVQQQCVQNSQGEQGFYSLTVPTGGGKTLASVLWALHHAVNNGLKRIIIGIPYTSIIEQTAQTLKSIFGEDSVLEHHSNFDYEQVGDWHTRQSIKLATENWDYPIIVTTNVQLFESLFSNKPSHCRKLHNIVNSVVILDEAQTLPLEFLRPIVDTLATLNRLFHSSILFTTASQPTLSGKIIGANYRTSFQALPTIKEIIPRDANLHEKLRRVSLDFNDTPKSPEEVAAMLAGHNRVLCIVNTRKDAKEIFEHLPDDALKIHLSRMMCPAHIKEALRQIKQTLDTPSKKVRVVATQLIEAGVDVDFPVVYRQEAGLDSILQAAGRCNREGKLTEATTYVFALDHPLPSGYISKSNNARCNMVGDFDWFSQEAMTEYFRQLYARCDNFDKCQVEHFLYNNSMQFETIGNNFRLIDDSTIPVVVNYRSSMQQVEVLKKQGISFKLLRQLRQNSVSVRQGDFKKLCEMGAIDEIYDGIYVIASPKCYHSELGLIIENQWLEETYII